MGRSSQSAAGEPLESVEPLVYQLLEEVESRYKP